MITRKKDRDRRKQILEMASFTMEEMERVFPNSADNPETLTSVFETYAYSLAFLIRKYFKAEGDAKFVLIFANVLNDALDEFRDVDAKIVGERNAK